MTGLEVLPIIALGATAAGTALSAAGSIQQGEYQQDVAKAQAQQTERAAGEAQAVAQREAIQRQEQAKLLLSRQQALAAAGGGSSTDVGTQRLAAGIAAEGDYQARSALFEGDSRAAGLMDQAALLRSQGRQQELAGFINAGSTTLSGISSFASMYQKFKTPEYGYKPLYGPPIGGPR